MADSGFSVVDHPPEGAPVRPGCVIFPASRSSVSSASGRSVFSLATSRAVFHVSAASLAIAAAASYPIRGARPVTIAKPCSTI